METIGLPLILLAAVWGAFTPVLKAIEMMNERRDKIFDTESKIDLKHRWLMLYTDWLAIFVSTYTFLGFIGILIFIAPDFADIKQSELRAKANLVFTIVGLIFVAISAVGFVAGGFDFCAIRKHLRGTTQPKSGGASPLKKVTEPFSHSSNLNDNNTTEMSEKDIKCDAQRWDESQLGPLNIESIRTLHQPPERFRISPECYPAGTIFGGAAGACRKYVLVGECSYSVSGVLWELRAGDIAVLPAGEFVFRAWAGGPIELVSVWELPPRFWLKASDVADRPGA